MVLIKKLDTRQLSPEAFEQYGDHRMPDSGITRAWASRPVSLTKKKGSTS